MRPTGKPLASKALGRPLSFTQKLADQICERLAEGESLISICADESMPGRATVNRWLRDEAFVSFRDQYARARVEQADSYPMKFERSGEIHYGRTGPRRRRSASPTAGPSPRPSRLSSAPRSSAPLHIDSLKWLAAKLAPKKYGDKVTAGHTGPGGGPIQIQDGPGPAKGGAALFARIRARTGRLPEVSSRHKLNTVGSSSLASHVLPNRVFREAREILKSR
jgi:hypothetical protein